MKGWRRDDRRVSLVAGVLCLSVLLALTAVCFLLFRAGDQAEYDPLEENIPNRESLPYWTEVHRAATKHSVEEARIYAVIQVESGFRPQVESKAGARGLMQMLPSTYREQCALAGVPYDPENLFVPEINIDTCTEYLCVLHELTGSWKWSHVAYFAGIGNVNRWREEGYTLENLPSERARTYLERIESAYDAYGVLLQATQSNTSGYL